MTKKENHPENGSDTVLRNIGNGLQDYMASQPTIPQSSYITVEYN
jgi:hypothetical protein